jgi:PAS domain S-box-containing protein
MTKGKVMIVEDEVVVSLDLQTKIQRLGYSTCKVVRYGENALDAASSEKPDLVLMDIKLKGEMDGVTAATKIREQTNTPIVFLTSFTDESTLERAKTAEPFAYLKKPVSYEELRASLEIALFKSDMDRKLREQELHHRTVADFAYDWEIWIDPEGRYLYMSPSCERITGYTRQELMENPGLMTDMIHPEDIVADLEHIKCLQLPDTGFGEVTFRIRRKDGEERWIEHLCQPVYAPDGRYLGRRASNRDITLTKKLEAEREALVKKLQGALAEIKKLSGLLPICSSCKKIRDDAGYWNQIESYIALHSEARFTHGICPECAKKLYPDIDIYAEDETT